MNKKVLLDRAAELLTLHAQTGDLTEVLRLSGGDKEERYVAGSFWYKLSRKRIWFGATEKKVAGWSYPETKDVFSAIAEAEVITIGDLGASMEKKSHSIDSCYGLVEAILSVKKDAKLYVKHLFENKELFKEIIAMIKEAQK